jgi:hypothetical protein
MTLNRLDHNVNKKSLFALCTNLTRSSRQKSRLETDAYAARLALSFICTSSAGPAESSVTSISRYRVAVYVELLESVPFPQRRLLILFSCSLLRYRLCHIPCEFCPLCGRRWLWDHFFVCQRLDVISFSSSRDSVLESVKTHIELGQWDALLHYIRFYLLEWCDILSTAVFPRDVIDDLCL